MHWVLPVILALAVAQSGCIGLTSADSAGGLSISPANLDFGGVPVGSTKTDTVTLTNSGSAPVTLSQTSISNEEYSLSGLSLPATLEAGQQLAFTIRFAPAGAGPSSGTATIVGEEEEPVAPPPPPAGTDSGTDSGTRVPFGALSGAPASFAAVSGGSVADRTLSPRDIAPRADEGSLSVMVAMNGTGLSASGPTITSQPVNQSVTIGQTASFGVTASGTEPLSYQWKKNSLIISGATASTYTTPPAASADSGAQFTVTVSDSVGEVTSSAAILTVTAAPVAPSITSQPANRTVVAGQTAAFSVTAAGTAPLAYQWRKNNAIISGATAASYTTPATTTADNGAQFSVIVLNSVGSVTSGAAILTVNTAPAITSQPVSRSVTAGQTAAFSVTATGTAPMSYQWRKNGSNISGATASSYTTPATTTADNGAQFSVRVTNSVSSVTSNAATLTVNNAPSITSQPVSRSVTAGQTAAFSVTATGTAPMSYQWRKNGANIGGATATSYTTLATTTADNNAKFTVVVSNSAGSVTSNAANLSVTAVPVAPSITTQPANRTVIAGQTAAFSVTATGTAPMSYQWRKNGSNISGATASSYTTPATTTADNGAQFSVMVTNSVGNITSNAASLTVNAATLLLSANPGSLNFANVNVGSSKVLPVTISNSGNSSVSIGSVSLSGPGFSASGVSSGQTLNPGQTATLSVTFTPAGAGSATGSVTVASNATNSPASVALSGSGVQPVQHSATLTWNASTSSVVGYHAYRGTASGGPYAKLTSSATASTTFTDSTVQSGQTYYYVVTAVASSGAESVNSNQTQAIIPSP